MSETVCSDSPARGWLDRGPVPYLLVAVVAALVVFWRLGLATLDEHEAKAALAEQGMVRAGPWLVPIPGDTSLPEPTPLNRWLIPVNNGRPRIVKTPLLYWVAAGLALTRGDVDAFSARLPSAIAAVACALATLALGRRLFPPRAALMGALAFATCVGFQKWGRDARPEMLLCLFVTAALGCFHAGLTARTRSRRTAWMLAFWVSMGLANLCKQFFPLLLGVPLAVYACWRENNSGARPAADDGAEPGRRPLTVYALATVGTLATAVVVTFVAPLSWWRVVGVEETLGHLMTLAAAVAAPLAWYVLGSGRRRGIVRLLPTAVPGGLLMLAMFLPWMAYVIRLFGAEEIINEQVAERVAGTGQWSAAAVHYYLRPLVEFTLPWVGLLPGALAVGWMKRFRDHRDGLVYLSLWPVGLAALLTAFAGKREHYLLPAMPALCLLMGFVAEDVFFRHAWIRPRLARWLGAGYGLVGLIAPLVVAGAYFVAADPHRWATLLGGTRWADSNPDPGGWRHLLPFAVLAGAVSGAVLVLSLRRRFRAVFALLVVGMVAVYVGFHDHGDLWDDRAPIADFARRAAELAGTDQHVVSWGDPQAKVVYYFGRYIPNVEWTRQRLERLDGTGWLPWITDPHEVRWVFCYDHHIESVSPYGFREVLRVRSGQENKEFFILMGRP